MNKFNRVLAGAMIALSVFLMGAAPNENSDANQGVTLIAGSFTRVINTQAQTVRCLFDELDFSIYRFDRVVPPLDTPIHRGMTIELDRAIPVYIQVDNDEPVRFYGRPGAAMVTIAADFSNDHRTDDDSWQFFFTPETARHRPVANELIELQTVAWRSFYEDDILDFTREYAESFLVADGEEVVYREGQKGIYRTTFQSEYVGGELVRTNVLSNGVYLHPLSEIVHIGVPIPEGMMVSSCGELFSYSRLVLMESTAYTLSFACTGRHPGHPLFGVTASGMMAQRGVVAVDTSVIPFHTRMYIEGYGFAVAGDRGGAIRGYKVDVFMDSMAEARQWGRRHNVRVWIIE